MPQPTRQSIRDAQVALWCAMKSHDAAHKDQDADLWEILKVKPAVREYEQLLKSPAVRPASRRSDNRAEMVSGYGRDGKTPEIDENHATSKGLAATHSARSLQLEVVDEVMPTDDSQGLAGRSSARPAIIRRDNE